MKKLFFGGVHPEEKKKMTAACGAVRVKSPGQVVIPLSQHIGVPCQPLVNVGDHVKAGQIIGDNEGMCVPVHASVSGTVTAIQPMPYPGGDAVMAVVIENDFQDTMCEEIKAHPSPDSITADELFNIIRQAGIVGMGGAAFSTRIKAVSGRGKTDTLIINACECEPYITADHILMRTKPDRVLGGIRLLYRALEPKHVILAIEDNKIDAADILKKHLDQYPEISMRILPTRYPQGAEKQLIYAVTGKEVPPGKLPADVACSVFNVATAAAVYQAVYEGMPLIQRIVTVTGEGVKKPQNFIVPLGTPFSELINAAGGLTEDAGCVIVGGPMMGKAVASLDVPVIKGTGAVLCLKKTDDNAHPVCIRCGKCVEACPMHLQPLYLYRYEDAGDPDMLKRLNLTDCMECGCCAYVCPGKLPLVEHFRLGKRALKEGSGK